MDKDNDSRTVGISFVMDAEMNRLLEESAVRSRRAKRAEASIRLIDHLKRYKSISNVGEIVETIGGEQSDDC
jgi:hypothetical protein